MKKIFTQLLTLLVFSSVLAVSCTNDDADAAKNVSVTLTNTGSTSATFSINASTATEYAYKVYESGDVAASNGNVLFTDADEVFTVENKSTSCVVAGLEGNSTYSVVFAFKLASGSFALRTVDVNTSDYDTEKKIQIIKAERNEIKFNINMPEGTKYRYALVNGSTYALGKMEYGDNDMVWLENGVKAEGSCLVELHDGDIIGRDPLDNTPIRQLIKPGMSFVVMVVECDDNYKPLCEMNPDYAAAPASPATRAVEPNLGDYSEQCSDKILIMGGIYAKQTFVTRAPLPSEGEVAISITTTERTASIAITPSEEVVRIGYGVWETQQLNHLRTLVGEDGLMTAVQAELKPETTAVDYQEPIVPGVDYTLTVIYFSDEEEICRSEKLVEFKAIESDAAVIDFVITPLDPHSSNKVGFNLKAPNKDCKRLKMAMDYSRSFFPAANGMGGATQEQNITSLVLAYGLEFTETSDKAMFQGINSEFGYDYEFDSDEDIESTLAVVTFNKDEKTFLAFAKSRSAIEPAKDPLTTDFFTGIDGFWKASYTYLSAFEADKEENYIHDTIEMYITDDPLFDAPETFGPDNDGYEQLHEYYVGRGMLQGEKDPQAFAAAQIQKDFADFIAAGKKFQQKYKDQNRKIIFGFELDPAAKSDYENHSPWDLFCDLNHSTYDVDQIFYDYGPKIFIEVVKTAEGDKIEIVNDYKLVPPLMSYHGSEYGFSGMSATAWKGYGFDEPTGIIAGGFYMPFITTDGELDSFEIGAYTDDNGYDDYYPAVYYDMYGMLVAASIGKGTMTVTRDDAGDFKQLVPPVTRASNTTIMKDVPYRIGNHFMRPRLTINNAE